MRERKYFDNICCLPSSNRPLPIGEDTSRQAGLEVKEREKRAMQKERGIREKAVTWTLASRVGEGRFCGRLPIAGTG